MIHASESQILSHANLAGHLLECGRSWAAANEQRKIAVSAVGAVGAVGAFGAVVQSVQSVQSVVLS